MHVLILPSWYPGKDNSAGIFILEQVKAISVNSKLDISVFNWGPNEYVLKIRTPLKSLNTLFRYAFSRCRIIQIRHNLTEYKVPHLSWSSMFFKGNYEALTHKAVKWVKIIEKEKGKIDLIHAHVSFPAGFIAYSISKILSIPFIITEHSGPFPFREYKTLSGIRDIVKEPLTNASQIIAVSSWLAENIKKYTSKVPQVIPNSVNTDFFTPNDKIKSKKSIPTIFTLSQLTTAKGTGDLLASAAILKQKGCRFVLKFGGSGQKLSYYKKLAAKLNISDYVIWLGLMNREEALKEYQDCDFYVMPSRVESLSMVILEAMACGKPIVSTDCGGPKDLVEPEIGILVKPDDPKSLAQGIEQMLIQYHSFDTVKIREICIAKYSNNITIETIINIYKGVLQD